MEPTYYFQRLCKDILCIIGDYLRDYEDVKNILSFLNFDENSHFWKQRQQTLHPNATYKESYIIDGYNQIYKQKSLIKDINILINDEFFLKHQNQIVDKNGLTLLIRLCSRNYLPGDEKYLEKLILHGADVSQIAPNSYSCLIYACIRRNVTIIPILIKAGANVNYRDSSSKTVLEFATEYDHPQTKEVIRMLLKAGAEVDMMFRDYRKYNYYIIRKNTEKRLNQIKVGRKILRKS
jgi:hypothetical protein